MITMFSSLIEEFIGSFDMNIPVIAAVFIELFVSLHMTAFVFHTFAEIFFPKHSLIVTIILLSIRVSILAMLDFVIPGVAMADFFSVFIGAFILVPLYMIKRLIDGIRYKGRIPVLFKEKLNNDEIHNMRRIISIIYGVLGSLIIACRFLLYHTLPIVVSLTLLTGLYIYLYVFYPKKHSLNNEYKNDPSNRINFLIYILIMPISLVFFINPGFIYECNNKECTVAKYVEGIKSEKTTEVPYKYKGKPVTKIGAYAFYDNDNLNWVKIPYTVKNIEKNSFKKCNYLEYVEVKSDINIDKNAFEDYTEIIEK